MFSNKTVKEIVMGGGVVEYKGVSICDMRNVVNYSLRTNKPYQVNLRKAKYCKETKSLQGDEIFNDLNEAVEVFIQECKKV